MQLPETTCARARESVSARLDDELTESELGRLETHLLVCPDCSAWAEQARDLTARLRATSLEEPIERLVLSGRGRGWRVSSAVAVASAAAVVATMFVAPGHHSGLGSGYHASPVSRSAGPGVQAFHGSSRVVTLDGTFIPIATPLRTFRPV